MPHSKAKNIADDVVQQQEESRKWFDESYYGEIAEVYRNLKCRTLPIKDINGNEIKGRTNVALPDHFVMRRKKTARLTSRMPNLRVTGGRDQKQRDDVSALMYWQWDKSQEQRVYRQVIDQCVAFGWSIRKGYWNQIKVNRRLRRRMKDVTRPQLMAYKGAAPEEIEEAVGTYGESLSEQEMMQAMAEVGNEISMAVPITKYDGPMGEARFIGDIFPEPGFKTLNSSCFVIDASEWDSQRLLYWTKMEIEDPETGEKRTALYPDAVQEMIDGGGSTTSREEEAKQNLRQQLREAINQSIPRLDATLRGKRYRIFERHSIQDDGRIFIDWVSEDQKIHLGRMAYPWDTYGQYIYTELVLMPDILGGVGDSSPRISRFLMQLRNARFNQIQDFLNKKLRPVFTELDTADIPNAMFERSGWTAAKVKSHDDIRVLVDPQFPAEAFGDTAQLVREQQQVEPLSNDFQPGTETVPNAGKLATTAVFQQRAADVVTADELKQIDIYLTDVLNLNLAMTQQAGQEPIDIPQGEYPQVDALILKTEGTARSIRVDPMEIQDDLHIMPETGSTLAADDDFKKQGIMQGYMLAKQDPQNFNVRAFAAKLAETMPGMRVEEALAPEQPPEQTPDVRVSVSINFKDLFAVAPDAAVWMLSKVGAPTAGMQASAALQLPQKLNEAATNAAMLEKPIEQTEEDTDNVSLPKVRNN